MLTQDYEAKITILADEKTTLRIEKALKYYYKKDQIVYCIERPLTERERDVLRLVIEGRNNTEIADALIISPHTVKAHLKSIMDKLGVTDRLQAAVKATKDHLV